MKHFESLYFVSYFILQHFKLSIALSFFPHKTVKSLRENRNQSKLCKKMNSDESEPPHIVNNETKTDLSHPLLSSRDTMLVWKQFELDGKRHSRQSTASFLATTMVGVPFWLTVLLPLTSMYQIGKRLVTFGNNNNDNLDELNKKREEEKLAMMKETFPKPSDLKPSKDRKYDVVLLGATGFTGKLTAHYIAKAYKDKDLTWAIAGRSKTKLDSILNEIGSETEKNIHTIIVDTSKLSTIHGLVKDTNTVITTAGPFCKYGNNVVAFCAKYGTNYVDITGETGWNKEMMMKWEKVAKQTGAKIISFCGCDSIPWDMTVYKIRQLMRDQCKDTLMNVKCYDYVKGGVSGGTIDTVLTNLDGKYIEPRFPHDPYYLNRDGGKSLKKSKNKSPQNISWTTHNGGSWTSPFIMSTVNGEVVKRSHVLDDECAATKSTSSQKKHIDLEYEEYAVHPTFKEAFTSLFGLIFGVTAMLNPITSVPMKKFLPKPGEGPTKAQRENGFLIVSGKGTGVNGSIVESAIYFPSDPGYKETARMVAESGLCLALNNDLIPAEGGGFFTPSVGMGDVLLERLCRSGCKFASKVVECHIDNSMKIKSKL